MPQGAGREGESEVNRTAPATAPVVLAGFCAFLNLYATQPVLPLLEKVFRASHNQVVLTVTAATAAVALAAPFVGQIADRLGRKRVIVASAALMGIATLMSATSSGLHVLIFWRFVQGLATPGIFAVTIAYINDEWPAGRAASAVAAYVSGTVLGGFSGRVLSGFIAEYLGWRWISSAGRTTLSESLSGAGTPTSPAMPPALPTFSASLRMDVFWRLR